MTEEALVRGCVEGCERAQKELFNRFSPKMLGVCLRYSTKKEQAEDALQEAFIKIFLKIKKFNGGSLEGWIRRIVINTSLDQIRKEKRFKKQLEFNEESIKKGKESYIIEGIIAEELLFLINTMPGGYRVVFNLFAIEGFSHKEIAKELGISEGTSKSQYSRARKHLKKKLEEKK